MRRTYTREETLEREFAQGLRELILPPAILRWLEAELVESEETAQLAHGQALRRDREDLERLRRRQEVMYEDRLDGRIDASTYDCKVTQMHVQREQIQQRIRAAEAAMPLGTSQVLNLGALVSRVAERFLDQTATEQRKLLRVVLRQASWKSRQLQISWQEPFEALRLANLGAIRERVDQELPATSPAKAAEVPSGESSDEGNAVNLPESSSADAALSI